MNDSPGWASPGSAPSGGQDSASGTPRPAGPAAEQGTGATWSSEQPPPGQWSAPSGQSAPPPPPAPGWGGGHPHGAWGRPPAAKPGVIPLRPLGVGEILDGAVSTLRAHWRTVLGITITVSVITQIANILVERYALPEPPAVNPNPTPSEAIDQSIESLQYSLTSLGPALFITLIGTLFTTALLTVVVSRSVLGRPVTLTDAWHEARPRLPQLLGLTMLLPLMSAGIMAVGLLPGLLLGDGSGVLLTMLGGIAAVVVILWLVVRFALASPALMLERQGVIPSLRRSAKLVRGTWWRVFGILLLTMALLFVISLIIIVPFVVIALMADSNGFGDLLNGSDPQFGWAYLIITGIGSVIASAITYPISAGVTVLLYIDQRIRREALDLELARAAGVPGYGSEPPGGSDASGS
ncbi:hypothetical protein QCN29_30095 [Streptomyces sp. HNM0663]|uniref:DUF7847 domain-containing protein n=1 Tax=Streptomyces chengmaiensis TaxID=3040919 RepID=A0ABT6HX96_9ACTN|nr:glycerophosphoryl diester phosphodiesterase membrane domain-containing protein [Streptomyces chengmaiensis]MDH2392957.1 hypothetical protein [Streptomyces chengmaiensis]